MWKKNRRSGFDYKLYLHLHNTINQTHYILEGTGGSTTNKGKTKENQATRFEWNGGGQNAHRTP